VFQHGLKGRSTGVCTLTPEGVNRFAAPGGSRKAAITLYIIPHPGRVRPSADRFAVKTEIP